MFGPLTKPGSDRIGPDRIGSDRIGLTKPGSGLILFFKKTHIYSVKVGAFQIPIKNDQVVSLDQNKEKRLRK